VSEEGHNRWEKIIFYLRRGWPCLYKVSKEERNIKRLSKQLKN